VRLDFSIFVILQVVQFCSTFSKSFRSTTIHHFASKMASNFKHSLCRLSGSSYARVVNRSGYGDSKSSNASTHGYSGDNEEVSANGDSKEVPSKIDMGKGHSKKRFASSDPSSPTEKRQKVMERNYTAHTAKHVISQDGLSYPKGTLSNAGTLIDMSHVTLATANDVDSSPFLVPCQYTSPFSTENWHTMMVPLVASTSRVYETSGSLAEAAITRRDEVSQGSDCNDLNEDPYSSASSMSDSEESDDNGQDEKTASGVRSDSDDKTAIVNMSNALALSNQARYVPQASNIWSTFLLTLSNGFTAPFPIAWSSLVLLLTRLYTSTPPILE
jgi:hypothetical protein